MEPIASVVDKLKGWAKSSEEFVKGIFHQHDSSARHNPIEILKRLQREAFSDIMKLRDRQDKVERMLSFYRSTNGSPFQEASTHIKGVVDVAGALLFVDDFDQQTQVTLNRAGIRTGIDSRFTFETSIRQKGALCAEFMASQNDGGHFGNVLGGPLSLTKVTYLANFSDWCSGVFIPWGGQCKDVAAASNPLQQERTITDLSSCGPPILSQSLGLGAGLMMKRSRLAASLAEFIDRIEIDPGSVGVSRCFSTVGQVIYQLSKGTQLTLLGIHKKVIPTSQQGKPQKFIIPFGGWKKSKVNQIRSPVPENAVGKNKDQSIAFMLESELDDSCRISGWVEMPNLNPRVLQWAITLSDTPQDEVGWGLRLGGITQGPSNWDHFQVEAFLKLNVGERFNFEPGVVYLMDGNAHVPALVLRSSWSL